MISHLTVIDGGNRCEPKPRKRNPRFPLTRTIELAFQGARERTYAIIANDAEPEAC